MTQRTEGGRIDWVKASAISTPIVIVTVTSAGATTDDALALSHCDSVRKRDTRWVTRGAIGYRPCRTGRRSAKGAQMPNLSRLPRPVFESYEWQESGLCSAADIDLFFVPDDVSKRERSRREHRAKQLCQQCPVLQQCRQHALTVRERFGVWGGMSAYERERAHGQRRAA